MRFFVGIFSLAAATLFSHRAAAAPLDDLAARVPKSAAQLATVDVRALKAASKAVDDRAALDTGVAGARYRPSPLAAVRTALDAKHRVDNLLDGLLKLRGGVVELPAATGDDTQRRAAARGFLQTAQVLIDLSGRLRYLQNDVVRTARERLPDVASREQLVDLLTTYRSTVGATQFADDLFEFPGRTRYHEKILRLVAASGQTSLLPAVLDFVADPRQLAPMRLFAAEVVRHLGVPQPPRPNPPETLPEPAVLPDELHELVGELDETAIDPDGRKRRVALLAWLDERRTKGVVGDSYRVGAFDVRPGDWLLMRNPSPYNLFTDLSPGLFTHVGVVAAETGDDGIRRFVIVDVPERGDRVPAVNVEIYLERTLHYFFVRDGDAVAAAAMGRAAGEVIDNPSQFDLNFRSERVLNLKGKPLDGVKVHTYCAGLLLLCALQTDVERDAYFPLTERQAGGYTVENVAKMGLSLGEGFISPSSPLFSPRLEIVGRREPMYDPRREIEEAVYDHFAESLVVKQMQAQGDWYQTLRLRTAEAAKTNPLLARAMASAAGVDADTDLVSAAQAAAVVETLDEAAQGASRDFQTARDAVRGNTKTEDAAEAARIQNARRRHADLINAQAAGRMSPRDVRTALVRYYTAAGKAEIDRRFFGAAK